MNRQFMDVSFNLRQLQLFTEILKQEPVSIEILKLIAEKTLLALSKQHDDMDTMNIKEITENVRVNRKVGVKSAKRNKIIKYSDQTELISRKMAEGIVNNLQFASLVYYKKHGSYKALFVTPRGLILHFYLEKLHQKEVGLITNEEFLQFLTKNKLIEPLRE